MQNNDQAAVALLRKHIKISVDRDKLNALVLIKPLISEVIFC